MISIKDDYGKEYHLSDLESFKEHLKKYNSVNFWRGIAKERRYNYHHRKLYRMMEGNTYAIQAQVKDLMLETLDGLVKGFTVYIKG